MTLALVTGASRGIGRATALKLAQQGYRVAVNYLKRADEAQRVVAQIREQGGEAFAVQADIAEEAQVMALFQRLDEEAMPLGVLVNNAGILFT
ncbi:MAG: SDR family NAD(P)-dependent oxidoreductase, partial [Pantoea sp.]|nr:SDR family NAD(P)-dependent oxidoreductase [Pantoea sp.]